MKINFNVNRKRLKEYVIVCLSAAVLSSFLALATFLIFIYAKYSFETSSLACLVALLNGYFFVILFHYVDPEKKKE